MICSGALQNTFLLSHSDVFVNEIEKKINVAAFLRNILAN